MRKVKTMKNMSKALVGTVAAGAMAMASASPAMAQSRYDHRDRDGIDAGDIIAGALIIGGIAAVASAAGRGRYDGYRGGYDGYRGGVDALLDGGASTPPSVPPTVIPTAAARRSPTFATSTASVTATR